MSHCCEPSRDPEYWSYEQMVQNAKAREAYNSVQDNPEYTTLPPSYRPSSPPPHVIPVTYRPAPEEVRYVSDPAPERISYTRAAAPPPPRQDNARYFSPDAHRQNDQVLSSSGSLSPRPAVSSSMMRGYDDGRTISPRAVSSSVSRGYDDGRTLSPRYVLPPEEAKVLLSPRAEARVLSSSTYTPSLASQGRVLHASSSSQQARVLHASAVSPSRATLPATLPDRSASVTLPAKSSISRDRGSVLASMDSRLESVLNGNDRVAQPQAASYVRPATVDNTYPTQSRVSPVSNALLNMSRPIDDDSSRSLSSRSLARENEYAQGRRGELI